MNRDPQTNNIDELERMIASNDDPLPPEVESRLRPRFANLRTQIEGLSTQPSKGENWIMGIFKPLFARPMRFATLAIVVVAAFAAIHYFSGADLASNAYAVAAGRIRDAQTLAYKVKVEGAGLQGTQAEMRAWQRFPGQTRMEMSGSMMNAIMIIDQQNDKMVQLHPNLKQCIEINIVDWEKQSNDAYKFLEDLRNLPDDASVSTIAEYDGRSVRVYQIDEGPIRRTLWLDDHAAAIIKYEIEYRGGADPLRVVMTDFQFNEPLSDDLFSLEAPAGYTKSSVTMQAPSEAGLIEILRQWHEKSPGKAFPESLNPGDTAGMTKAMEPFLQEMMKAKAGALTKLGQDKQPSGEMMQELMQEIMPISTGLGFAMQMKPQNDWHWDAAGKSFGNPADWIAWYKPDGAQNYRVIHGDLSVTEVTPAEAAAHTNK